MVSPSQRLLIHNLKWAKFESVLEELGEHRSQAYLFSIDSLGKFQNQKLMICKSLEEAPSII